jgi:hypothetical protein
LDEDSLVYADDTVTEMLGKIRACTDANHWPGRYPDIKDLTPPPWVYPDEEEGALDGLTIATNEEEDEDE